jgi:hypothetical protein
MLRLVLLLAVFSSAAFAQGTEGPAVASAGAPEADSDSPEAKTAKELVTKYLTAVKAKKWADAKKLLHPKTLEAIAQRKKRLGKEDHPMAPWFHEKTDYWMKDFRVTGATEGPLGTVVVETSEDNFQVQEKGLAPGEMASYLVGKHGGTWYVVDKKRGETFTKDSVRLGYKGWFDKVEKTPNGGGEATP